MSCYFLLQGIFPTQGLNPQCRGILYHGATTEAHKRNIHIIKIIIEVDIHYKSIMYLKYVSSLALRVCSNSYLVMSSNHLILCHPLLPLPSTFPRVFSNESVLCIRWPKYCSFSFSIIPYNEYLELISFRIHWFDLLAVQGTLKSLLQHHSSKESILWCSAFFIVQLSYPDMTTRTTIALTRWIFVSNVSTF